MGSCKLRTKPKPKSSFYPKSRNFTEQKSFQNVFHNQLLDGIFRSNSQNQDLKACLKGILSLGPILGPFRLNRKAKVCLNNCTSFPFLCCRNFMKKSEKTQCIVFRSIQSFFYATAETYFGPLSVRSLNIRFSHKKIDCNQF